MTLAERIITTGVKIGLVKLEDPYKGVFSEAARASLALPVCIDQSKEWGCGVYNGVIPENILTFMQLQAENKSGLEISIATLSDQLAFRAWVRIRSGESKVLFIVKSSKVDEETKRNIFGVKIIAGQISRFKVEAGSEELSVYNSILKIARENPEISEVSKSSCKGCT